MLRFAVLVVGVGWIVSPCLAAPPNVSKAQAANAALSALLGTSTDAVAGAFRGFLAKNLPPLLYEDSPNWGHQANVLTRVDLKGPLLKLHTEKVYTLKNHGTWRKVQVHAPNLTDTLVFDIRNLAQPEPGKLTFEVFLSFDVRIDYEQQDWANGVRLYAGSATVDARVKLAMQCEVTARIEKTGSILPDVILGVRVSKARLNYDNFKTEHLAGLGGEAARLLGEAVRHGLEKWNPGMEKELLAKADAAIVKAGQDKEVRLSLNNLFGSRTK
jgi:hypothetical protein